MHAGSSVALLREAVVAIAAVDVVGEALVRGDSALAAAPPLWDDGDEDDEEDDTMGAGGGGADEPEVVALLATVGEAER